MIEGCRKTLDFYHIQNYELFCSDIGDIEQHIPKIDAIVTDFPYGRATTTKGEHLQELYERTFDHMHQVLKKGKRIVVGLSNSGMIPLGEQYFSLVEVHPMRVHRSLTRYFTVYQS